MKRMSTNLDLTLARQYFDKDAALTGWLLDRLWDRAFVAVETDLLIGCFRSMLRDADPNPSSKDCLRRINETP